MFWSPGGDHAELNAKIGGDNFTGSLIIGHSGPPNPTDAKYNTGVGVDTLSSLTTGDANVASGAGALNQNTTGCCNTASGVAA